MASKLDEAFYSLASSERRRVLTALLEHNPRAVDDVSTPDGPTNGRDQEHLLVEIHHTHLPRLEGEGFIQWDRDTQQVTKGPRFDELRPLLDLLEDDPEELTSDE